MATKYLDIIYATDAGKGLDAMLGRFTREALWEAHDAGVIRIRIPREVRLLPRVSVTAKGRAIAREVAEQETREWARNYRKRNAATKAARLAAAT